MCMRDISTKGNSKEKVIYIYIYIYIGLQKWKNQHTYLGDYQCGKKEGFGKYKWYIIYTIYIGQINPMLGSLKRINERGMGR